MYGCALAECDVWPLSHSSHGTGVIPAALFPNSGEFFAMRKMIARLCSPQVLCCALVAPKFPPMLVLRVKRAYNFISA